MPKPVLEGKCLTATFFLNCRSGFDSFFVHVARLLATDRFGNIVKFMSVKCFSEYSARIFWLLSSAASCHMHFNANHTASFCKFTTWLLATSDVNSFISYRTAILLLSINFECLFSHEGRS